MKKVILVILLCFASIYFFFVILDTRIKDDGKIYKAEFDSLKTEIFRIKAELDEVKANTDTLKVGQRIIFDEVKKNAEKSFWDFFKP